MPKKILHLLREERSRWVLWLPVGIGLGVGLYFALPQEPVPWLGAALLAFFKIGMWLARRRRPLLLLCLAGAALSLGFTAAQWRSFWVAAPILPHDMKYRDVTGLVEQIVAKERGVRLVLRDVAVEELAPERTPYKITVSVRKGMEDVAIGDHVALKAGLFPPPRPVLPSTYDFARDAYFDRIGAVGFAQSEVTVTQKATASAFSLWLAGVRYGLAGKLQGLIPGAAGAIAAALVMGEMKAIPEEAVQAMRDSGLAHVLSISGLHMALAAGIVFIGARLLLIMLFPTLALRLNVKKIAALLALASALAYLLLAGNPVPAQRSFIMVAFVLAAVLFDRRGISLYSLAWAAVLILLIEPDSMLGASFQMSFAATMAMLAFYERFGFLVTQSQGGVLRKLWRYMLGIVLTSLVATLATLPLAMMHFNRVAVWGMLANLLVLPLVSVIIMPSAVLFFLLMPFGLEALGAHGMEWGIELMLAVAHRVAELPGALIVQPSMTGWGFLLCVAGGLWLCLWSRRWRLWGMAPMLVGLATVALYVPPDVMIGDDGKKVAVRSASGELTFLRGTGRSFDAGIFLRGDGKSEAQELDEAADLSGGDIACDKQSCRYARNGHTFLLLKKHDNFQAACAQAADVLAAPFYVDADECLHAARIIDRRVLYREGAHVLYFDPGAIRIRTVNEQRGIRPWVK